MIDLAPAGAAWSGWFVGRWGRAKEWRLHAPDGATYTPQEISGLRALTYDVDFLSTRVLELMDYASADAMHFGPQDAAVLIAAMKLIERASQQLARHRLSAAGVRR